MSLSLVMPINNKHTQIIKLAIDIRDLRIAKTGARTYLTELITHWSKQSAIEIVLIDTKHEVYTGKQKLFKLIEHILYQYWKQWLLPRKAKQHHCTHLLCTDFFLPYFKQGLKTITVLHDAFFWESPEHYNAMWLQLFHTLAVPAAKKADAIIVPSQYVKEKLLTLENFDASKLQVIYEAAKSFDTIDSLNTNLKQKQSINIAAHTPYFFHLGVMEKRKNLPFLINAFKIVNEKYPHCQLVLAGNRSNKEKLDDFPNIVERIEKNGLTGKVHLIGFLETAAIAPWYQNAFAYVLPSLNEGFGLPLVEAFGQGIPVIASNAGALPEIADQAAMMVDCTKDPEPLAAAMIQLIKEPALRASLIEKGIQRNAQFSWDRTVNQISQLIQNI